MFGKGKQVIKLKYYEGLCGFSMHAAVNLTDDVDRLLFQPDRSYLTASLSVQRILDIQLLQERDFMVLCHNTCPPIEAVTEGRTYMVIFYASETGEKRFVALYEDGSRKGAAFCSRLLEQVIPPEYSL